MKKKRSKLIIRIVGIGILIVLIVNLSNSIILKSSIPDKFKDAKWKGNWESESFSLLVQAVYVWKCFKDVGGRSKLLDQLQRRM